MKRIQQKIYRARSFSSPEKLILVDKPETWTSRRTQGLPPEFAPLPSKPTRTVATTNTTSQQNGSSPTSIVYFQARPRTLAAFYGYLYKDVDDGWGQYERVVLLNGWGAEQSLRSVYFALEGTARTLHENHEASISSSENFQAELLQTLASQQRLQRA